MISLGHGALWLDHLTCARLPSPAIGCRCTCADAGELRCSSPPSAAPAQFPADSPSSSRASGSGCVKRRLARPQRTLAVSCATPACRDRLHQRLSAVPLFPQSTGSPGERHLPAQAANVLVPASISLDGPPAAVASTSSLSRRPDRGLAVGHRARISARCEHFFVPGTALRR